MFSERSTLVLSHFRGQNPFFEVWYGKLNFSHDKAFWFRYTLLNGKDPESALWAIFFDGPTITAYKKIFPLESLQGGDVIRLPLGFLDSKKSVGNLGPLQWNLTYQHQGLTFNPLPEIFRRLHLTKSLVCSPVLDAQFSGTLIVHEQTYTLHQSPGMIGHIWGKKHAVEWVWSHCNLFDNHEGIVFEGLCARISLFGKISPPLTSLFLKFNGKTYLFNRIKDIFFTTSDFGYGKWNFSAHNKEIHLTGQLMSPAETIAVITYTDTDGSKLYCHNSKLSHLKLTIEEKQTGKKFNVESGHKAAFEWVTRSGFRGKMVL